MDDGKTHEVRTLRDGTQVIEYGCGVALVANPEDDLVALRDIHGDVAGVSHETLCAMLPALTAFARHRSFTEPTATALRAPQFDPVTGEVLHATPSDLAGLAAREAGR